MVKAKILTDLSDEKEALFLVGRKVYEKDGSFEFRESMAPYNGIFGQEMDDQGRKMALFGMISV